jgi:hypothetical protein
MHAVVLEEHVAPPGFAVTKYLEIGRPPLEAGAVQLSATCPLPKTPTRSVGTDGADFGTTTLLGRLEVEAPTPFTATAVKL